MVSFSQGSHTGLCSSFTVSTFILCCSSYSTTTTPTGRRSAARAQASADGSFDTIVPCRFGVQSKMLFDCDEKEENTTDMRYDTI